MTPKKCHFTTFRTPFWPFFDPHLGLFAYFSHAFMAPKLTSFCPLFDVKIDHFLTIFCHFFWQKTKTFIFTKIDKNHLFFYKKHEIPSNSSANPIFGGFWEDPFFDPKKGLFILESSMYIAFYTSILGTKKWKTSKYRYFWQKWYLLARIVKKWVQKWGPKISLFDQKYHFLTHLCKNCTSVC